MDLSHIIFLLGLAGYLIVRAVFQRSATTQTKVAQKSTKVDKGLVLLVVIGQIALPAVFMATPLLHWASDQTPPWVTWCGAAVQVAGLWLFWKSHADLGNSWSVALDLYSEHKLVTHGVYGRIRHPMYASFLLMGMAQALLLHNWVAGWSALLSVSLLYLVRTPNEEKMMIEGFGDEYRRYMQRTGGVIPLLVAKRHA